MGKSIGLGLLLLAAVLPRMAMAQGIFTERGQDAVAAAVAVSGQGNASALSVGVGYSLGGSIDAGLVLHRYRFDDYYYYYDRYQIGATGVQLHANLHLVKQNRQLPISLGATSGFQKLFFSDDVPNVESPSGWSLWLGGFASHRFDLTDRIAAVPQVTLGLAHGSFSHTTWGYGRNTISGESLFLRADGHLAFRDDGGRSWIVTPFLSVGDNGGGSGLAFGGVFP